MSTPTPGARRAATPRARRKPVIAAAAALTLAAVVGTLTLTLGDDPASAPVVVLDVNADGVPDTSDITVDLDNDGEPDTSVTVTNPDGTTEEVPLATIATERDLITTQIAPHDPTGNDPALTARDAVKSDTTQTMLTPGGDDWWTTLTSFATDLYLWDAPTPTKATWYALTGSTATADTLNDAATYSAVHVGFKDETDARAYFDSIANNAAVIQWVRPLVRGTVLTFASTWVDAAAEPFPTAKNKTADLLANLRPKVATWTINYGRLHTAIAADGYSAEARTAATTIYANLGYTDDTQWNGVATNPEGPWTGKITGYNPDAIDFATASAAVTPTVKHECFDKQTCYETELGLIDIGTGYVYATPENNGFGRNYAYLPTEAPQEHIVRFGIDEGYAIGLINGTKSTPAPPIRLVRGWITPNLVQVLHTRVEDIPTEQIRTPTSPTG